MNTRRLTIGFLFILFAIANTVYGQVYKLKATSFSSRYQINEYSWSSWTEASESSVLIVFDQNNDRITIYSEETQVYDIAEYEGKETDGDGDDIYSYYCVDKNGLTCRVSWVQLNSQNGRMQFYVMYNDMNWLYNVYQLD